MPTSNSREVLALLGKVKRLAQRYYVLTGRPLGVTGEVAEYEAIRLLGLTPAQVRQSGYDAVGKGPKRRSERLEIKGRCVYSKLKSGARMGAIDTTKNWDAVLLALLDPSFEATEIYRAERPAVSAALSAPGSRARNDRGQLAISKFRAIGRRVWSRDGADS
jgi:hypothetical protein